MYFGGAKLDSDQWKTTARPSTKRVPPSEKMPASTVHTIVERLSGNYVPTYSGLPTLRFRLGAYSGRRSSDKGLVFNEIVSNK